MLHIGPHKTGTTSLQQFLHDEVDGLLAAARAWYPTGLVVPTAHSELPLLTVRPERTWPARIRLPETCDAAWLEVARAQVRSWFAEARQPRLVLSHEDLSYLRSDDELDHLRALLGDHPVRVIAVRRDRSDFLHSYASQLHATGFPPSEDPTSFAYVEPDSWVADHDALLAGFRRTFGEERVEVVDYEEAMARDGSVIPALADRIGIPRAALPALDAYRLNQRGSHLQPSPERLAALRRRLAEQAR